MVIKGGSRGGAGNLASHLLRADTNERVEITELTGVTVTTLPVALREMTAMASGTRCSKPLYHASINTGPAETLTATQKAQAITTLEQRLGLAGHPRAVVEHRKAGREHIHVVWGRVNAATMRAVHDRWNYRTHEQVARQLEREFGHARVQGVHVERDGCPRPARTLPAADVQQAARTGRDPAAITAKVTRLWQTADSGKAFAAALHQAGYVLAQGDKRGFCLVDPAGGVHSLARRIEGVRTKEVTGRLAEIELASLPTVDQARQQQRQQGVEKPPRDPAGVSGGADPLPDPAPPCASHGGASGGAGISAMPTPSPRPQAVRQHDRASSGGMTIAATRSEAPQRSSYTVEAVPIVAKPAPSPEKSGNGRSSSETLYSAGICSARPAAGDSVSPAAATPARSGMARAAGVMLGSPHDLS